MSDQCFCVVYDPTTDRFMLQDEPAAVTDVAATLPWHEWVLPPKSATKASQRPALDPLVVSEPTTDVTATMAALELASPESMDLAITGQAAHAGAASSPASQSPTKRARVRDYTAHFAHANAQLPLMNATHDDQQPRASCITWNGEPLHVSVACTSHGIADSNSLTQAPLSTAHSDSASSVQHVFELTQLARIRPFADGYRVVNAGCTFAALTSSSSSSSEDERVSSSSTLSDDDIVRLPVFARGDRVVVRARRRRFHGTVARRIGHSSFYDVRAASGTLFAAVSALRMRLLPPETQPAQIPQHDFGRGDRVLWVPASNEQQEQHDSIDMQQTYKARVVQRRSRSRFDIELRTGRIRYKVPSSELAPAQW